MKKAIYIFFFLLIFFLTLRYLIADTGLYFAVDYLKNKIDNNYTSNQVSIQNKNIDNLNHNYLFKDIIGLKHKYENSANISKINKIQLSETDSWIRSNGGNFSNKFSNLQNINLKNIKDLDLYYKINLNDGIIKKKWMNNVETNPIFYEGVLFFVTPFKELIALNIKEKKILWKFNSLKKIDSRGISLWINKENLDSSCIFVPIRNGLFCINYKNGKLNSKIGNSGFIKTGIVRAAPVIWNNYVIVATVDSQKIKYFDLKSGKKVFELNIHPDDRQFKGGSPWGGISIDIKNNLLFLTTGNPRPALLGSSRKGPNKNANSIIAIDLMKKKIAWSFQEVSHDLWDYDIASPPLLTTIRINKKLLDVVIVTTKIGNTLIFDRLTGNSFHDIFYDNVPISDFFQEEVSPKQINLKIPEPLIKLETSINDLDDRMPLEKQDIINNLDNYKFGKFVPPSFNRDVLVYGLHGGAQWPGGVFNPYTQNVYIQVNQIPWLLKLFVSSIRKPPENLKYNYQLYIDNCSQCHKENREGIYITKDEKVIKNVPSLIKIFENKYKNYKKFEETIINKNYISIKSSNLKKIHDLFLEWDKDILKYNDYKINFQWSQFLYSDNLPVTKPPWGEIVSINTIDGKINWRVPNGYIKDKKVGTSNFGGLIGTAGGLIFATGTEDKKIIAINSSNGQEVWAYDMVAAGSTAPITFEIDNKQYLAVIASGGRYHNYTKSNGELYIFSLK
jgi:quinoprotein glucose dehydrogenase